MRRAEGKRYTGACALWKESGLQAPMVAQEVEQLGDTLL